jgi:hypothetical protein
VKCLKCGSKLDLSAECCPACGTPLDADGDGVPDALDALVERKARAIVAAEQAKLVPLATAAPAPVVEDSTRKRATFAAFLERNRTAARPLWLMNSRVLWTILIVGFVLGGTLLPACAEPLVFERSLVAASLLCPQVCAGCRGPGRIFTWHESSNSFEGNVSTQLCQAPAVDVNALSWSDVTAREDKDLQPYRLTLWSSVPFDFALVLLPLLVFAPFLFARLSKTALAKEQLLLEKKLLELERQR